MAGPDRTTKERRRHPRWRLRLPVRVQGRDADGSVFEEMTSCTDASAGGASIRLAHPVRQGQALLLSLPLPAQFRQYDVTSQSYRVYALVRSATPSPGEPPRVGLLFYGRHPPQGAESLPGGLFLIDGDPRPASSTAAITVLLRLPAEQAPGGVEQEERAAVESVGERGARVKVGRLPLMRGAVLRLEEIGGEFATSAEVEQLRIGADGEPRVDLVFLDAPPPERWGPPRGEP